MDADPTLADRQPVGPDLALAIQLEHRATQNAIVRSYGIMPSSRPEDDDLDRAAAVRLRKLDAIDPDELRAIGDRLRELDPYWREAEERKQLLYALADAMGGTE